MKNDGLLMLFDFFIWMGSIYCFYSCYFMYKKQTIHFNRIIIPADLNVSDCTNPLGYIRFMVPRLMAFSCTCFILGGINLLSDFISFLSTGATLIIIAVLLGTIFWFWAVIRRSRRLFW